MKFPSPLLERSTLQFEDVQGSRMAVAGHIDNVQKSRRSGSGSRDEPESEGVGFAPAKDKQSAVKVVI